MRARRSGDGNGVDVVAREQALDGRLDLHRRTRAHDLAGAALVQVATATRSQSGELWKLRTRFGPQ